MNRLVLPLTVRAVCVRRRVGIGAPLGLRLPSNESVLPGDTVLWATPHTAAASMTCAQGLAR